MRFSTRACTTPEVDMDVAAIILILAGLAMALAKSLLEEHQRSRRELDLTAHLSRLRNLEDREHI
jgi:hypothetical protein